MSRKRLEVDWHKGIAVEDLNPVLKNFEKQLKDNGLRASTIVMYVFRVSKYLEFANTDEPTSDDFIRFHASLREKRLSRSTVNNYLFSIKKYHEIKNLQDVEFEFIKPDNHIPYYFDENDIMKIFSVCRNTKHKAMLMTLFYAGLRVSEICELDDSSLDLKNLTIRVRGKGGKEAICYISNEAAHAIKKYLEARPEVIIENRRPLFITDFGQRWNRRSVSRMFIYYKQLAKIEKHGSAHVFSRHSLASMLIKNNCDIVTVKELMRHESINTTMRYIHISDSIKREKYERCVTL